MEKEVIKEAEVEVETVAMATPSEIAGGGTLVAAMVAEPESLDPAQSSAQSTVGLTANIYESLLQYGENSLDS